MNPNDIADAYIALWNETDGARRKDMLRNGWAADATYIDPLMKGEGRDQIDALIGAVHQRFPGHAFALHGKPDGHNDRVRFSWRLSADGGDPAAVGTDIVLLDGEGRLKSVTGFLDHVAGQ
ncbi:nuclear transport factor 2 family protein [Terrarubrum flagellatum]|uniref:nuclear transport factor 2 family protein n=1 Tax=Terrirubrum flagellatum TaxID=2895980 RepID=UPI003145495F